MTDANRKQQDPVAEEDGTGASHHSGGVRRLHSSHSSGMESSVLKFKNVNFIVGKGDKQKNILRDVNGTVKWGRTYR